MIHAAIADAGVGSYHVRMEKRPFGQTGLNVTPLGFGGAEIGFLPIEQDEVTALLNRLLDLGVNLIDTAAMYKVSEELIGNAVAGRRDDFILVSKCGTEVPDIDHSEWSPELITKTVDRALTSLKTDRLDVMLLHSCDLDTLRQGDALDALIKARDAGKIRHVGYSGDNDAAAWAAARPDIKVIQTSINICDQRNIEAVLPICREHEVGVMVKRPIANAAWRNLDDQPGMYKGYAKTYTERLRAMGIAPADLGLDGDPNQLWPNIALRFTVFQPGVHVAIVGTTKPKNVEANIKAIEEGPLPDEVCEKLCGAFTAAERHADEHWPGQT